ncbi:bifunctional UDP-N-acetylglucosamine diphosphorylase/glucosamine-1-phosphate N-acetyltransferase GlmU [Demequina sp.]|uniref:bifunctional UDP-N-acetylglucosamine diphosphorylase/glucosamine-1-phosphate N-acetyltransferase GlmU n=1 Tax=Demequina sp. TaxID=2050685 RepID=UPI003D1512F8
MSGQQISAVIILAAGAGTRMNSATPKVLHSIAGRSLLHHAVVAANHLEPNRLVVVVRHERDAVAAEATAVSPGVLIADQDDIPGTGRAVYCGLSVLDATAMAGVVAAGTTGAPARDVKAEGIVLVTSADVPLVTGDLLAALTAGHGEGGNAVTMLTARVPNPGAYGRIIRGTDGEVLRIVEAKDASDAELAIDEINAGIYAFDAHALRTALASVGRDNAQREMYLTDVVEIVREAGGRVGAFVAPDAAATEGVNDRVQLAAAAATLNRGILEKWMREGVTIVDPTTTWIDADVTLEPDSVVYPGTQLLGATSIATGASVGPDTTLKDVEVRANARVIRTHGELAVIGEGATVGPFSYLRPGTVLGADGKIGAFVETKNAMIGAHTKVPHLSYVGDATIGEHTNIGAATIFVNYDGVGKAQTSVGSHVRIGSDNTLIAPLTVGDGAYTGAGAIIRKDVPPGAMARNSAPQQTVEGWVEARRPGTASAQAARAAHERDSSAATKGDA